MYREAIGSQKRGMWAHVQAAGAIAALAQQHAQDTKFMSPYIVEASRQGFELSFWEKITSSSFEGGEFRLGTLRVRHNE